MFIINNPKFYGLLKQREVAKIEARTQGAQQRALVHTNALVVYEAARWRRVHGTAPEAVRVLRVCKRIIVIKLHLSAINALKTIIVFIKV